MHQSIISVKKLFMNVLNGSMKKNGRAKILIQLIIFRAANYVSRTSHIMPI
jgi:hypothetical protein